MSDELVLCPYCRSRAHLVDSKEVYGKSYGLIWLCRPCDAWVGTHKNSATHKPLGRLANAELRAWRQRAHEKFDLLWRDDRMDRDTAYAWMRETLNMTEKQAHIGKFEVADCLRLINALCARR